MDAALKKSGVTLVFVGVALTPIAPIAGALVASDTLRHVASLASSAAAAVFVFGCIRIAQAKGQPWFYGLLGLLSCLGLAILWFAIPDKNPGR